MSTLPPTPTYNPNIPIISSAGGTSVAYKDPKSPESIMKKTTLLNAQTAVDSTYDVDVKKEGFVDKARFIIVLYVFVVVLFILLFTLRLKSRGKLFIFSLASLILALSIWYR
jgi:hypothetical protein